MKTATRCARSCWPTCWPPGAHFAQVPVRRAGLAPVRGHHRAARVLPTRTEAAILAAQGGCAGGLPAARRRPDRPGRGQLRQAPACLTCWHRRYVAVDIRWTFCATPCKRCSTATRRWTWWAWGWTFRRAGAAGHAGRRSSAAGAVLPGSSIGNFTPVQALGFLRSVHAACGPAPGSGLLIGVDLVRTRPSWRPPATTLGVTAAFNRNLLPHINRLAGTDFAGRLAPCGAVQRRAVAHRDAPGSAAGTDGALAGRRARLCHRRAHPYGERLQVDDGGL